MTDLPHAMMMRAQSGDATREAFWGELQTYLEAEVRPGFRAHYQDVVGPKLVFELGRTPDRCEIAAAMRQFQPNRAWYVARTEAQRQAFDASRAIVDSQIDELASRAAALGNGPDARARSEPTLPRLCPDGRS